MAVVIVDPFPAPPALIAQALAQLRQLRSGDPDAIQQLDTTTQLPRPWLPASCPEQLRHHLWLWCDEVADWLNRSYTWRASQLIPACWPQHPHLAAELPALACQRLLAEQATNPDPLEEWHRQVLPLFLDRMAERLGETGCRTGSHHDWPAAARYHAGGTDPAVDVRRDLFYADTHPARQLRPAASHQTRSSP